MLSCRLSTIKKHIPKDSLVADIGSDHGYLVVDLVKSGSQLAYATDISLPSLNKARRLAEQKGVADRVICLQGDGFEALRGKNIDVAVIAGLGGRVIVGIMDRSHDICKGLARIILQPMKDSHILRRWLHKNGYFVFCEDYASDDGRIYQIICARSGEDRAPENWMLGKKELAIENELLYEYIDWRISILDKILAANMDHEDSKALKAQLTLAQGWKDED